MLDKVASGPFITRDARRDDHAAFTRFWAELGLDQGPPDVDWWDEHLRPRTMFLAAPDGALVGYSLTFPFGDRGDVRQIAVDRDARRRGVGKALMVAVAARLRREGASDWRLEVKQDNAAAIALYRSVGMDVIRELVSMRMTVDQVRAFAATRPRVIDPSGPVSRPDREGSLRVETVEPADDAIHEARWDLGRGQLARWRKARGPNARLMAIADRALAQYTPDFTPAWGLIFPLYAIDREHAAAIFGAITEMPMTPTIEMQFPDGVAAQALIRAGAHVIERLYEMGGRLPV